MRANDIRRIFLEFFRARGHRIVPSSSLVPDDATLLLTTAGMVQFKPFLLGKARPEYARAASVQKCARTSDIEVVGLTARHMTFFEMLGNFSFGDYYKREACLWAWELVTEGFGLAPDRLWVTVFETDDEAADAWHEDVGVPADRIVRRGAPDNFWSMGVAGPCGPCSEIFYDRGPAYGNVDGFEDGDRIVEFWNLVFMESEQDDAGTIVGALPSKNVDTGMGLDRIASILQGVPTVFDTDLLAPILARAQDLCGRGNGDAQAADVSLRILAEHARAATFLIGDGVFPSNEERGYVLRRLIRRAVRHARILGTDSPVMGPLVEAVVETMGEAYPELTSGRAFIAQVASQEEESFRKTLRSGLFMLEEEIAAAQSASRPSLQGAVAFKLHDTYGFPLDLTVEIAKEAGLDVDRDAFDVLMEEQRERARLGRKAVVGQASEESLRAILAERGPTKFLGYEREEADALLIGLLRGSERVPAASEGEEAEVLLDATPFYAEGGGQVGDTGIITTADGILEVLDTQPRLGDLIAHRARVRSGEVRAGSDAHASVDAVRRAAVMRSHTATHVLHATLRSALGPHARQAGSLVDAGRLRFDFPHMQAVARDLLDEIEGRVNERLVADDLVRPYETTLEEARASGALALFGEKYGDIVRVVEIGDYSIELCGGTHVAHTSQVGPVKVLGEASIGANLRRIEALTGLEALEGFRRDRLVLEQVAGLVRGGADEVAERVRRLMEDLKGAQSELELTRRAGARERARALAQRAEPAGGAGLVCAEVPGLGVDELQKLAVAVREAVGRPAIVVLGSQAEGRAGIAAAVTKDLVGRGVSARSLVAAAARVIGGGGGGKDEVATGGGNRPEGVGEALRLARDAARAALGEGR